MWVLKDDLIFEPIGSDVLVFDPDTNVAHSLTGVTARVALLLRAGHSLDSAAKRIEISTEDLAAAVSDLKMVGILLDAEAKSVDVVVETALGMQRRKLLAQGLIATAAAGAISSIRVPDSEAASSCTRTNFQSCTASTSGSSCCTSGCCCLVVGIRACGTRAGCISLGGTCI